MAFKVGDWVIATIKNYGIERQPGKIIGVFTEEENDWVSVSVEFDLPHPHLHNLEGECHDNRGWWFYPRSYTWHAEFFELDKPSMFKKILEELYGT